MSVRFDSKPYGDTARLYSLTNDHGICAALTDYGATLVGLHVPDRQGRLADVTLGYETLAGWMADRAYMGATIGRYGNRISQGRFPLDGRICQLAVNTPPHHLHGGDKGFNKHHWTAQPVDGGVVFRRVSPHGEEHYPGTLAVAVTYTLTDRDELCLAFEATTDQPTIVNLVHHTYWNLTGDPTRTTLDHELHLAAEAYVPVGPDLIPTGNVTPVAGTPLDFTQPQRIGERIRQVPGGYDHCWVIRGNPGQLRPAARLYDPFSGRQLEIATDQPGIQFYAGNSLDGTITGKGGIRYQQHAGLCLETEQYPDAPNHPLFPTAVLRPGESYTHRMTHRFTVR